MARCSYDEQEERAVFTVQIAVRWIWLWTLLDLYVCTAAVQQFNISILYLPYVARRLQLGVCRIKQEQHGW